MFNIKSGRLIEKNKRNVIECVVNSIERITCRDGTLKFKYAKYIKIRARMHPNTRVKMFRD